MTKQVGDISSDLYAMSLEEIAKIEGVSKQVIVTIEKRALAKVVSILIKRGYKFEDFFEEINETDWKSKQWVGKSRRPSK
tara:strand:- start:1637 stop:1876 length:240 start_codon:yes stop_codon:yes gene_type:complete